MQLQQPLLEEQPPQQQLQLVAARQLEQLLVATKRSGHGLQQLQPFVRAPGAQLLLRLSQMLSRFSNVAGNSKAQVMIKSLNPFDRLTLPQ